MKSKLYFDFCENWRVSHVINMPDLKWITFNTDWRAQATFFRNPKKTDKVLFKARLENHLIIPET